MRRAFTLIEVNMAMLIMAGGILSIVGLYALGFRENKQSRDDVISAEIAQNVLSQIATICSATNASWNAFSSMGNYPSDAGWGYYIDEVSAKVTHECTSLDVINESVELKLGGYHLGVVITHDSANKSAIATIGVRASKKLSELMVAPLYYTEVRFQGDYNK